MTTTITAATQAGMTAPDWPHLLVAAGIFGGGTYLVAVVGDWVQSRRQSRRPTSTRPAARHPRRVTR